MEELNIRLKPAQTTVLCPVPTGMIQDRFEFGRDGRLLQKHPFRLVFFEGGDHGLSEHRDEVNHLGKDWLDRYLRERKPWPNLEPHGP